MRRPLLALLLALGLGLAPESSASVWPSAAERLEKELKGPDVDQRRHAAGRLLTLPDATGRRLAAIALDDPDVEVRLSAAQAAVALDLPGLGDRVVPWLSDGERRLRLSAAEALQTNPAPRGVAALGRALSDSDPAVRGAAAGALGASGSPEAVLALLGHLDDSVPEVRRDVALALARLGDPRAVVPLIGKIEDGRPLVRRSVARALGELGDGRAVSALVLALRDSDESVRVATIEALGRIGHANAAPSIISMVKSEQGQVVYGAAVEALARIGSPQALDVLIDQLAKDEPGRERATVLRALRRVGAPAAAALKRCLAGQPTPEQADGCALGIGEVGMAGGGAVIRDALGRGVVRPGAALEALGALGDRDALPVVLEYVADADPVLRRSAVAATAALLDPTQPDGRAVEPIVRALGRTRSEQQERVEIVRLLGRTGSPRAAPTLIPIAENAPLELRSAAIEALGMLGPAGQQAVLIEGLSAEEGGVRLAAALAVRRSASAGACMPLLDLLERSAEQDRAAIGLALAGPLSRNVDPKVLARVERAVRASSGAERDLLLEAMGRVPGSAAVARLSALAKGGDLFDRAKIAEALAAHPEGLGPLVTLARDVDGAVRANAVWALGGVGTTNEIALLRELIRDRDVAAAGNAAASLGRIAARFRIPISNEVCPALSDSRSYVRSNALRALRLAGLRCPNAPERRLLLRDRSEVVREAAAWLIRDVSPSDVDRRALSRCAEDDPSGAVAAACAGSGQAAPTETESVVVYVVPIGEPAPVARAPFALVFENGLMRLGVADRRGAVFEVQAPRGDVALAVPAPLAE